MSLFWLRIAVGLYGFSMLYALAALLRRREILSRATLPLVGVAVTLHFVALVETFVSGGMAAAVHRRLLPLSDHVAGNCVLAHRISAFPFSCPRAERTAIDLTPAP